MIQNYQKCPDTNAGQTHICYSDSGKSRKKTVKLGTPWIEPWISRIRVPCVITELPLFVRLISKQLFFVCFQDGFYCTLQRRARVILANVPHGPDFYSAGTADLLALGTIVMSVLAAATNSLFLGCVTGLLMAMNVVTAHNFLHQKDNWRMYYFNLSFMSFRYNKTSLK